MIGLRRLMMAAAPVSGGNGNLRQVIVSDCPIAYLPLNDAATVSPAKAAPAALLTVDGTYPPSGWEPAAALWPGAGGSINATPTQTTGVDAVMPGVISHLRGYSIGIVVKKAAPGALAMIVSGDESSRRFQIRATTTGHLEVIYFRSSNAVTRTTSVQVCDGLAHLIHVVDDIPNNQGRIYVDGVLADSAALAAVTSELSHSPIRLGGRQGSNPWRGQLSDFAMYSYALPAGRVSAQAEAFVTGAGALNPAEGFRYWRITVPKAVGNDLAALQEMEIRASPGGAKQNGDPFNKNGGQARESSHYDSATIGVRLGDGNLTSPGGGAWVSNVAATAVAPQWVILILPDPQVGGELALLPQNRSDLISRSPEEFTLECSKDGETWELVTHQTGIAGWGMGVWKTWAI